MSEPHPMRCKTCAFYVDWHSDWKTGDDPVGQCRSKEPHLTILENTYSLFGLKGCASHSQHPATDEQSIRQDEREKVLDELDKRAIHEAKTRSIKEGGLAFVSVQVWIEELRRGKPDGEQR